MSDIVTQGEQRTQGGPQHLSEIVKEQPTPNKKSKVSLRLADLLKKKKAPEAPKETAVVNNKVEKSTKKKKSPLTKKQMALFGGAAMFLLLAFPLYLTISAFTKRPKAPSIAINLTTPYFESAKVAQLAPYMGIALDEPDEPKTKESPINGVLLTQSEYDKLMARLPVAVMVNNHIVARPQSNLSKADIVFESIAESGITRHLAIYWKNDINKVGPIRSARQYHLEWLSPFDAIYIHDGYASSDDPRVNAGGNIYTYGIKSIATYGAWREYDGVRFAPHNEYSSPMTAWERAVELEWGGLPTGFESWKFKRDALKADRGDVIGADVVFWERLRNGGAYDVHWAYDETTNTYLRSVGGAPDIDQENNLQVSAKVVILQTVVMTSTYDDKGHVIITTIGEGDATILQDGKALVTKWKKNSRTTRTHFFDSEDKEIELNRGLVWVEAVPKDQGSSAIIKK